MYTIKVDEIGPIVVKVELSGAVVGRLVDDDGKPLQEAEMSFLAPEVYETYTRSPKNWLSKTGSDSRFRAEGLIPGRKYGFRVWVPKRNISGLVGKQGIVVGRGETRDLGDVKHELFDRLN